MFLKKSNCYLWHMLLLAGMKIAYEKRWIINIYR